jgi:hypothetical protein
MYAAIRQGKAKAGMVEELTRKIKEEAIPIIAGRRYGRHRCRLAHRPRSRP